MVETGYSTVGASQMYYETSGDGPAVVFLHAGIADSRMWRDQISGLDTDHRMIAFDQRGFGQTLWAPEPYADRYDTIAIMDHLEVESAVIVGCSIGGSIALHVALDYPERVDGLVLIGTAAAGWDPPSGWYEPPVWERVVEAAEQGDYETALRLEVEMWVVGVGRDLGDVDSAIVDLAIDMNRFPIATEEERGGFLKAFEPPVNTRLDEIDTPTLVVVGEYDMPDLIESAEYLSEGLSERDHVLMKDTAHLPSLERPEAFNRILEDYLDFL